ncbi:MAG: hypothetical protein RLZZ502_460 [Pseudomonadota bacterium]|jgi:predicted sulfurtransferase
MQIVNIATYRFVPLAELARLKQTLLVQAQAEALKGTILLAEEGINLFLAGSATGIDTFVRQALDSDVRLRGLDLKRSYSDTQPFKRLKIKIKKEIVTFKQTGINPALQPAKEISPQQLKQWLDEGRDVLLLDTRNEFEYRAGAFKQAVQLGNHNFVDFAEKVKNLPLDQQAQWKQKTVVSFCTGGIRCEKAAPFLSAEGYQHVLQLKGGILRYFEEVGKAHYEGDCFVFDERRALDPTLAPAAAPTSL